MGKKGFNSPFGQLKGHPKNAPERKAEVVRRPPPAAPPAASPGGAEADAKLFMSAMAGTSQVGAGRDRVAAPVRAAVPLDDDEELALAELRGLVEGQGSFRVVESEEMHTGIAPGVNFHLLHQLQKGHFAYHRHLDLHGYQREGAHSELIRFVGAARRDGERCVLVITGRGKSSPGGISVLRDALPRWLSRAPIKPHVLAFCTARNVDGGPGAFYVLLRRSGVKPFGTVG